MLKPGPAKKLIIYVSQNDRYEGVPLYEAIVKRLKMVDIACATVYKGVIGYGSKHILDRSRFSALS